MTEKLEINVPTSWDEIKLGDYQELCGYDPKDEYYDAMKIGILCNLDPEKVKRFDPSTYFKVANALAWTTELPKASNYKPIIKVNEKEYGLVKMSKLTNGDWYSLEEWIKDVNSNLHRISALIYRPLITAINDDYRILEEYDSDKALVQANEFKQHSTVGEIYGALAFFLLTEKMCLPALRDYLGLELVVEKMLIPRFMKRKILKRQRTSLGRGDGIGIPFYTRLLKATLQKSRKLQNSTLSSV